MTATFQQQIANNLNAAERERAEIRSLELQLVGTTDKFAKTVLKERIKICRNHLRWHLTTAQKLETL